MAADALMMHGDISSHDIDYRQISNISRTIVGN